MADNHIQNLDKLLKKLNNLQKITPDIKQAVSKETLRVQGEAKALCPVRDGELRKSIKVDTKDTDTSVEGIVYTNKEYAVYVEFGTGPKGQANHSGTSPAIQPVYRQDGWVYHDDKTNSFYHTEGQPAQPYMYPALKNNEKSIVRNLQKAVQKAIDEASE